MAGFIDLMFIADYGGFQSRVAYPLHKAAIAVMAEDPATAGHVTRVAYAKNIIGGGGVLKQVATAVLTNPTIAAAANKALTQDAGFGIIDSDIEFAVNSLFNALAGVAT